MDRDTIEKKIRQLGNWHFLIELEPGVFTIPRDQWKTLWHSIVVQDYITRTLFPLVDLLNKKKPSESTVIDIGCNEGWLSLLFHRIGFKHVVGIDSNEANIKKANFLKEYFNMKSVEFYQADINDFRTNEKFDFSIMLGVINHTHNPVGILQNIHNFTDKYLIIDFDSLCEDYVETSKEAKFDTDISSVFGNMRCHFEPPHQTTSSEDGNLVFQYSRRVMELIMNYAGFDSIFHALQRISAPPHYKNNKRVMMVGRKHPDKAFYKYEIALDREYMESRDYMSFQHARLEEEGYHRFNIVKYGGKYYGIPQGEMEDFDIVKVLNNKKCLFGDTISEVKSLIDGDAGTALDYERDKLKYMAGCELILQSKFEEARKIFDDLEKRHGNTVTELTVSILYQQGRIAKRIGNNDNAKYYMARCLSLEPEFKKASIMLREIDNNLPNIDFGCHKIFY